MDVIPPSSMQRFMICVGLGKKKKLQKQSSLRHSRSLSRPRSRWEKDVGRPISAISAKESVKSARDEGPLARRSTSKSATSESGPSSLGGARVPLAKSSASVSMGQNLTRPPQPKPVKTFFGTLTNKLRVRAPARRHTRDSIVAEPERVKLQSSLHRRKTSRDQAVSIPLPDDIASRQRRAEALRSRGLLPSRLLSAIEAEEDSRIDALQANGPSLQSPDSKHSSDASDIAQSWRSGNSMWLTLDPMTPLNLVPEVLISSIDSPGDDNLKLSTDEVDLPPSSPLDGSTSLSNLLPSDAHHSPVPSLQTTSPAGSNDEQEGRPSLPVSLISPSSEGLTGQAQHSVIDSTRSEENFPVGKSQTEIVGDAEKQSSLSTPASPSPSERSFSQLSHIEESQVLCASSSSRQSASPSRVSEDSPTPRSPRLPPSPCSVPSPRPAPSRPLPPPPDLSASPQISFPDAPPLRLYVSESDTLLASPTSPTVPSLFCSSSSEMSHSTVFTDNGETLASPASCTMPVKGRRGNLSPIAVKNGEGGLCEEVIVETSESFPEDDLDPFAGPSSTAPVNLKVDVSAGNTPRRKPLGFLGMAKKRALTLDSSSNAGISKSASMNNLCRSMTSAFQARARPLSPVEQSPPLSPISVTMHNSGSILAEASLIVDDETRRLSEVAFM